MSPRLTASVAIAIIGLTSLGGCGWIRPPAETDDVVIQRAGDSIIVGMCTDLASTGIVVQVRKSGFWAKWVTILDAVGEVSIEKGDRFDLGNEIDGLTTLTETDFDLDEVYDIGIDIRGVNESLYEIDAGFDIPDSGLSASEWLHTDGDVTNQPCE